MALDNDAQNNVHDRNAATQDDMIGHDDEDLAFLHAGPGDVVLNTPKPPQRLEQFSVICIICNRMIGKLFQTLEDSLKSSFCPIIMTHFLDLFFIVGSEVGGLDDSVCQRDCFIDFPTLNSTKADLKM